MGESMPYDEQQQGDMIFIPGDEHAGENDYSLTRSLPPGDYDAKVVGAKKGNSSRGGAMITLSLGIAGPEGGVLVIDYITLAGDFSKFDRVMRAVDPSVIAMRREAGSDRGINFSTSSLLDRTVRVRTGKQEYQGEMRNRVNDYIPMPAAKASAQAPVAPSAPKPASPPNSEIVANPFATEEAPF